MAHITPEMLLRQNAINILRKARAKITMPGTWTKRCSARNLQQQQVQFDSAEATSFCMLGALANVQEEMDDWNGEIYQVVCHTMRDVISTRGWEPGPLVDFNDAPERIHSDVLWVMDAAVSRLERNT